MRKELPYVVLLCALLVGLIGGYVWAAADIFDLQREARYLNDRTRSHALQIQQLQSEVADMQSRERNPQGAQP